MSDDRPPDSVGRPPEDGEALPKRPKDVIEEPPPILGTWNRLYGFVILWLIVQMAMYFAFTRYFA